MNKRDSLIRGMSNEGALGVQIQHTDQSPGKNSKQFEILDIRR